MDDGMEPSGLDGGPRTGDRESAMLLMGRDYVPDQRMEM